MESEDRIGILGFPGLRPEIYLKKVCAAERCAIIQFRLADSAGNVTHQTAPMHVGVGQSVALSAAVCLPPHLDSSEGG
jgi:hypothetical protein